MGRAARNVAGKVILYADKVTSSIARAVSEAKRRRAIQEAYNQAHGITPRTVYREIGEGLIQKPIEEEEELFSVAEEPLTYRSPQELEAEIARLAEEMKRLAKALEFEKAAKVRDRIRDLKRLLIEVA
jgi:excinuclease ABC subunit B